MTKKQSKKVSVGDWIRFNSGKSLEISEVRYIQSDSMLPIIYLITDKGSVPEGDVLEIRRIK